MGSPSDRRVAESASHSDRRGAPYTIARGRRWRVPAGGRAPTPITFGPVPLGLMDPHRVSQERRVQLRVAGAIRNRGDSAPRRPGDDDVGPADGPGCAEIDRAREPVATAPRRQRRAHPTRAGSYRPLAFTTVKRAPASETIDSSTARLASPGR